MPKSKKNSKSPPAGKKTKKLRVVAENVLQQITNAISERHPIDVDENTKNPLLEALLTGGPKKLNKRLRLGCTKYYVLKESDMARNAELHLLNCQELRDVYSVLRGAPTGMKSSSAAPRKQDLINLIICIENEKKGEPQEAPLEKEVSEVLAEVQEEPQEEPPTIVEPEVAIAEPTKELTNEIPPLSDLTIENDKIHQIDDTELPSLDVELSAEEQQVQDQMDAIPENKDTVEYNKFLANREKMEYDANSNGESEFDFLYPEHDDPDFSLKIAKHKEFNDTKFDGEIRNVKKQSDLLCNAEFELLPHQVFVKNFLSFQTPYNALLLYHSLGTGKTCSSIGIAEEMRSYMKQVGINQRILIVASPNVQKNFRLQLFDERKLVNNDGVWSLDTCVGSSILKEINPTNLKGLNKETVVKQINALINQSYVFIGYFELTNYIKRKILVDDESVYSEKDRKALKIKRIRSIFDNRLIIIDEVHNIRMTNDNKKNQKTAGLLMEVVKHAHNLRLLLLSATPMYNSYKEIIMLTNLMNSVDKRSTIKEDEVFDKNGEFLPERTTTDGRKLEGGRELLKRKLTGYVSYVRGENPYTFPFRVYPDAFAPEHMLDPKAYPSLQMNKRPIDAPLQNLPVYLSEIGEYQQKGYDFIINYLRNKSFNKADMYGAIREMPTFENMESFGFMNLKQPLEALNMVFPNPILDSVTSVGGENDEDVAKSIIGKEGLSNVMTYKTTKSPYMLKSEYEYKPEVLEKYGRIFSPGEIAKYSNKISSICNSVKTSTGIIIVYSQYIDGGVVPLALALEEMGFSRFGSSAHTKSLFKTPPMEAIDALTMLPREQGGVFNPAKYIILSGDPSFSADNLADIKHVTNSNNKNGEKVKVILITKAASEGLDFKNIRQVHILDPWYNLNRTEQTIGRGVRNLSHCQLPFEERNVEIYLHGTKPRGLETTISETSVALAGGAREPGQPESSVESANSEESSFVPSTIEEGSSEEESMEPVPPTVPVVQPLQPVPVQQVLQPVLQIPLLQVAQVPVIAAAAPPIPQPVFEEKDSEVIPSAEESTDLSSFYPSESQDLSEETLDESQEESTETSSIEEPADLYVYRYAEQKAVQIGKVTRLLKEIAVDCILNIAQTNFTIDKITALTQNQNVHINLSSKKDVEFKIGDRPFTDVCDYMDNCSFTCSSSTSTINDSDIIKTTYSEDFARMNYSMIVKRIRQLFRENYFYTRENLIKSINILKPYPVEQIDYVLTRFIDNKNDYLLDKYGRRGYLTNRDNYYAFQPVEITDENSSLFDRSVPLDYKPYSLELQLPNKVDKEELAKEFGEGLVNPETVESDISSLETNILEKYNEIIETMKTNMSNALLGEDTIIESGENDWYKNMCNVYNKLHEYHGIPDETLAKYIIQHNLDTLTFQEKLILVRHLYKVDSGEKVIDSDPMNLETIIKNYFNEKLLNYRNKIAIVLVKDVEHGIWKIFEQDTANKLLWREIEDFEYTNYSAGIKKFIVNKSKMNNMVGFMSHFKSGDTVFKTKFLDGKWNNKGVFCNIVIKKDTMKRINDILDEPVYTDAFIKQKYTEYFLKNNLNVEKVRENGIYKNGLCVILEIILIYYNETEHKVKIWFFDIETTMLNGIITFKKN